MSAAHDLSVLPSRDRLDEDRFVVAWSRAVEEQSALLLCVVSEAIEVRRPLLAARLVGLLEDDVAASDPYISRARSAARLLVRSPDRVDPVILDDFMSAWRRGRKVYMDRVRRRHRARRGQKRPRQPRRR